MNLNRTHFVEMDEIAARTWPAESTDALDNWLLRESQGVTKRANSVLAIGEYPKDPAWPQKAEKYYKERGLPSIFHVSGASPDGLDKFLADNGYIADTPCLFMTANSQEVREKALQAALLKGPASVDTVWTQQADAAWIEAFLQLEQFPETRLSFYTGLFERMPEPKGFVRLLQDGETVAAATAILEDGWAGFVNVVVSEACRGQGLGYSLMHALTAWSLEQGATKQYLQVIADNKPAVNLYEKLGYQALYGYHYRIKYDL
ncbi:GNAT family N-acetyltransferase [Paenibacillus sedimenti]|uniref:GNAT family N-acetyltransferase n=1 Tax=Paenibacillus sedimenti TaxID=2770274 RepID=A0A926KQY1_9BACL|nr:GNAT family N-acetyltransferase [Paenibacillus sedimenti]MBD0380435.1 GNAT family N-acetyltransferase [Paenibacillus sedimenti]